MQPFRFSKVYLESFGTEFPDLALSSVEIEDRLAPLYERLKIPAGTLEKLSGVKSRYMWKRGTLPSVGASKACSMALEGCSIPRDKIGAIINCSVSRDYFEPATACLVHQNIGLSERAIAFDVSNACIGFSNGLMTVAQMIESGAIEAGIIVSCETVAVLVDATMKALTTDQTIDRDRLLRLLPTFTLGCGAVAWVLCNESLARSGHRYIGSVTRSRTEHSDLCIGNVDYQMSDTSDFDPLMNTESAKLMASAAKLGGQLFKDFSEAFGWSREDVDHLFCHQVGKQVNEAFYREVGLDIKKEYTIYQQYGNLVSAALPTAVTMGAKAKPLSSGEKVLLTAYGSGLNSIFSGFIW